MLRPIAMIAMAAMTAFACGRTTPDRGAPAEAAHRADDRSPCAAMCERLGECGVPEFIGVPACTRDCEDDPRQRDGPCRAPRLAYEECVATKPCPAVIAAYGPDGDAASPCAAERRAVIACQPDEGPPFVYFQF